MIKVSVKLAPLFEQKFRANVKKEIRTHLKKKQATAAGKIQVLLGAKVIQILNTSPEHSALMSNRVIAELGVLGMEATLQNIYQTIASNISVAVVQTPTSLLQINIGIIQADYSDILSLSQASFISRCGYPVPWLEWLLTSGTDSVVQGSIFIPSRFGRTGRGIMIPNCGKDKPGFSWSVPAHVAGTEDDNFITRSIKSAADQLTGSIGSLVARTFK